MVFTTPYYGDVGGLSSVKSYQSVTSLASCESLCLAYTAASCIGVFFSAGDKKCKIYDVGRSIDSTASYNCDLTEQTTWLDTCPIGQFRTVAGACAPSATYKEPAKVCPSPPPPATVSGNQKKRDQMTLAEKVKLGSLCPKAGWEACSNGIRGGFECVDTKNDLWSCGGCAFGGTSGTDCSSLPGVDRVSCQVGACIVETCRRGWSLNAGGKCHFNHARKR